MTDTILTITGSDGTGGSGVQADIRFISQMGGVAASAVTSITVQNTLGIQQFYDLPAPVVRQQVEAIVNDLQPQVVKIGLLRRIDVVEAIADVLRRYSRHMTSCWFRRMFIRPYSSGLFLCVLLCWRIITCLTEVVAMVVPTNCRRL